MRQMIVLVLALLLLLTGCTANLPVVTTTQAASTAPPTTTNKEPVFVADFEEFGRWLDRENMVGGGIPIEQLIANLEKYSYDGLTIKEIRDLNHGIFDAYPFKFSWSKDIPSSSRDGMFSTYLISTQVPLDGLSMAYGISFGDTLADVLDKLMDNFDPHSDLVYGSDPVYGVGGSLLYKEGQSTLSLYKTTNSNGVTCFQLEYHDKRRKPVEGSEYNQLYFIDRYVRLRFSAEQHTLEELVFYVLEVRY